MLEIKRFEFGPFGTNTYVVSSLPAWEGRGEAPVLLIDPACSNEYERRMLYDYIHPVTESVLILATHGHLDHLWGAAWACKQWHTPVLMHEADIPMAEAMQTQYNLFGIRATPEPFPVQAITGSQFPILNSQFPILNSQFSILPTPGHTPGGICLYFPEEKVLFSGDTLFRMGYGRTDLPGGDISQLMDSLNRLFALPPETTVYPGHGESTTIGAERLRLH